MRKALRSLCSGLLASACAIAGCAPSSSWAPMDLSGSTLTVAPANIVAGPDGRAETRVVLRRGDGSRLAWAGLRIAVQAGGCGVGRAAAVSGQGEARVTIGPCPAGSHAVRAALVDDDFVTWIDTAAALNAYLPAGTQAIAAGAAVNLAIDADYGFVGNVRIVSSDPLARLPAAVTLTRADRGQRMLLQEAVLRTPGPQTITAVDVATGRVLGEERLVVAPPATRQDAPASATALRLTAPAEVVAGVPITVMVQAVDSAGQPVIDGLGAIALTTDDPQARLPAARPAPHAWAVLGDLVLPTAGVTTLTARAASGHTGAAQVRVRPGPGSELRLRPASPGGNGPWLAGTGPMLEVTSVDAFGNAADDGVGAVQLASSDARASLPAVLPPAADGAPRRFQATFATVGTQSVTAQSALGLRAISPPQLVVAGPPARLVLTLPTSMPVAAVPLTGFTVATTDAYGNPVGGFVGHVVLSCDDPGASLPAPVVFTADALAPVGVPGAATFARIGATTVRAIALPAAAAPVLAPAAVEVRVTSPAARVAQVTLVATGAAVADGAQPVPLALTVTDAQGQPVAACPVELVAAPGVTVTPTAVGTPAGHASGPVTDARGSLALAARSAVAGTANVTATVGGIAATAGVTFLPGPAATPPSSLTFAPPDQVADGSATTTVRLRARDAQGNPIGGAGVVLDSSEGSDLLAAGGILDATGELTTALRAKRAGERTVTARLGGTVLAAPVSFVAGPPAGAGTLLTASPRSLPADGRAASVVALLLGDALGNPIAGRPVHFTVSGSGARFDVATAITDAQGLASTALRATTTGSRTVLADVGDASFTAMVDFTSGPAVASGSSVTVIPQAVPANGIAAATVTLLAVDAAELPASAQEVMVTSPAPGLSIGATRGVADSVGRFATTLRSRVAGTFPVTLTVGDAELTVPATFLPGPPVAGNSRLQLSPSRVRADGTSPLTLRIWAADEFGNPVPGVTVALSSSGSGNMLQPIDPVSGATGSGGVLDAIMSSSRAESKIITASLAGARLTGSVEFVAGPPFSDNTVLSATPSSVAADGATQVALRLLAADSCGNPVAGAAVTLTAAGGALAGLPTTGFTAADGTFAATVTATTPGTRTLTATLAGARADVSVIFTAGGGPAGASAAQSTLTLTPAGTAIPADGASALVLTAHFADAAGTPLVGLPVTLHSSGTGNVLTFVTPVDGTTDAAGNLQARLTSSVAEVKTLTAALGGVTLSQGVSFVPGPPTASTSQVLATPGTVTADGTSQATLRATLRDAQGNVVPGQVVTFSVGGTGNAPSAVSATTAADGTASISVASTVAEAKSVTTSFAGTSVSTSVTFVAGVAVAGMSQVVASPATVTADGTNISTLTATVRDARGNPVPGQLVGFGVSGASSTLSAPSATTASDGTASVTVSSTVAESKSVTASFAGTSVSTSVTFVAGAVVAGTSSFAASPATVTADGAATTTLTVTARDAQGNPILGQAVSLASTGTGNTFSAATGTTSASGVFTATLRSTVAQAKALTATLGGVTLNASATFVAGAAVAGTSSVTASPGSLTANGSSATTLTVTVLDGQGNPVADQAVVLTSSGSGNTFSPASGTTNASGIMAATLASTVAEAKTVTASFAGASVSTSVSFVAGAAVASASQVVASPASLTADGVSLATLTATIRDAQGNVVPGQSVDFGVSGTGNALSAVSATTAATGTASVTVSSTVAEAKAVTASFASTSVSTSTTFVAGPVVSGTSTLAASPATVTADGTAATTVTVIARDAEGNAVAGQSVTLAVSGAGNAISATSGATDASGVVAVTLRSTVAETKTLTASMGAVVLTAGVTFAAGAPVAGTSSLTAGPAYFVADGASTSTLTATVRDAQANPVPGVSVTFAASGTGNSLTTVTGTTSASGTVTSTLSSTVAETKTLTATFAALSVQATVDATNGPVAAIVGPALQTAVPLYLGDIAAFQATMLDASGRLVIANAPTATFTSTDPLATLPGPVVMTAGDGGVAHANVTFGTGGLWSVGVSAASPGSAVNATSVRVDAVLEMTFGSNGFSCARLASSQVTCWGNNANGQLGVGDTTNRGTTTASMGNALPVVDFGPGRSVKRVGGGLGHSCAVLDNDTLKCWGLNVTGGLGLGDGTARGSAAGQMGVNLPAVDLGTGRTATQVAGGANVTCARLDNGSVKCWGANAAGSLGIGDTTSRGQSPGQMGDALPAVNLGVGRTAQSVAVGGLTVAARLDNNTVVVWGFGSHGQMGQGNTSNSTTPVAVNLGTGRTARAVVAGGSTVTAHICALLDDYTIKCWGRNGSGQLGLGDTTNRGSVAGQMGDSLPPVNLGTGRSAVAIGAGYMSTCALLDDATVKCWGQNNGFLGLGDSAQRGGTAGQMGDALPAVNLGTGRTAATLSVMTLHSCAVLDNKNLKCWGGNVNGALGVGDTTDRGTAPAQMGDGLPAVVLWQ